MPMSWLYPALQVHRSLLPLTTASSLLEGDRVTVSVVASMGTQVLPSLPRSGYCCVLTAVWDQAGSTSAVSRVGEKVGELPAAAAMVAPIAGLFVFQTICTV